MKARAVWILCLWLCCGIVFADNKPEAIRCGAAIRMEKPGLPNLNKITDDLYRGAQPTGEGFRELKKMGIRTVINLRSFHSDTDMNLPEGVGYVHIPMLSWQPKKENIVEFLRIVGDKKRAPVFVHCQHGADRTGISMAVWRIVFCGWTKEEAIREMTEGGFGFHAIWQNLIAFVKNLDIEAVRREAGIR